MSERIAPPPEGEWHYEYITPDLLQAERVEKVIFTGRTSCQSVTIPGHRVLRPDPGSSTTRPSRPRWTSSSIMRRWSSLVSSHTPARGRCSSLAAARGPRSARCSPTGRSPARSWSTSMARSSSCAGATYQTTTEALSTTPAWSFTPPMPSGTWRTPLRGSTWP